MYEPKAQLPSAITCLFSSLLTLCTVSRKRKADRQTCPLRRFVMKPVFSPLRFNLSGGHLETNLRRRQLLKRKRIL